MRKVMTILLVMLAGCELYFSDGASEGVPPGPGPGPEPDPALPQCQLYFCREGTIYKLEPVPVNPDLLGCQAPDYDTAEPIDECAYGCRYENLYQGGPGPCAPAPPPIYDCAETGSCTGTQTQACSAPMQCGLVVSTGACTCGPAGWSCQPACSDGLCSAAAVQQAIVGTWTGTVTTPFDFKPSYQTTLTVAPNGDWSATGDAFYYGGNGGTHGSKLYIQAQTSLGAYGIVRLFLASVDGQITGLRVEPTRLRFTFVDSWLGCGRSFQFDLHRQ